MMQIYMIHLSLTLRHSLYENAEQLTREMVLDLIDHITVDAFEKGKDRNIRIFYKFIDKGYSDNEE